MKRKILVSPGYGAGWTTWNPGEVARYMLDYEPIISAIERGETVGEDHPAVLKLQAECLEKFGESHVCVLGADDLIVVEVDGPVHVTEYDGYESFDTPDSVEWI